MNNPSIFVAHPRTQHSQQLALALHEKNLLQAFWSGVPVISNSEKSPFWLPKYYADRIKKIEIPAALRRHPLFFQAISRASDFIPNSILGDDYNYRVFHLFDWWIAKHILQLKPKVVVAYEDAAYHTFQAAKKIGARCILDAPSLHHITGAKLMTVKKTPYLEEINRRKDKEVQLADLILTCSPLAAESYIAAGVESKKVRAVLLGATLPTGIGGWIPHSAPLHFIFAGVLSQRKAIDIILATFKRLHAEAQPYQLSFVGGEGESGWIQKIEQTPHAKYYSGVSQAELFKMLAMADCLLLPSRFDSFGMVVAEAMACGTPAIVSTQTGAKAMIEKFPNSGWIVHCDEESFYTCIAKRIENRAELFLARKYASDAAKSFTWTAYRERVGKLIDDWQ